MSEYEHNEHLLDEIQRLRESNFHLRKDCEEQKQRIKRLEEELEQAKQDRNAIAKNTREPLLLKLDHAADRIKRLEEALAWYESTVSDCNRHGPKGDVARDALAKDQGRKAKEAKP